MRLAFCLFKYFKFGGLQRDFRAIISECVARGHQVYIYTLAWQGEHLPNTQVHVMPFKACCNHTKYQKFSHFVAEELTKKNYDLIIGFNKMAGLDVYYAADPCYQEAALTLKSYFYRLLPRYRTFYQLEQAVFSPWLNTTILSLAQKQINEFHYHYYTPLQRFVLLPPWLNSDRFPPENVQEIRIQTRADLAVSPEEKMLIMVGSGFKTKGLDRALRAVASLPSPVLEKTLFFIIGQDKKNRFERLAKKLKIKARVKFLGGRNDIPKLMFAADALIHPAYRENTGNVLLEALVAGLPVITTDVCGFADYVQQSAASIVLSSPYQQTDLNQALLTVLTAGTPLVESRHAQFADPSAFSTMPKIAVDAIEHTYGKTRQYSIIRDAHFFVYPKLQDHFGTKDIFAQIMKLTGTVYRSLENRKTLSFQVSEFTYFAKLHYGIGWKEVFKNIIQGKWPIFSAENEFNAIRLLEKLGINTLQVVGYGTQGCSSPYQKSFLLTEALTEVISLEDLSLKWQEFGLNPSVKRQLIQQVASIAKKMHAHGMTHRDFYICHFLLDMLSLKQNKQIKLYLIDLHRAKIYSTLPARWRLKDISGLYYSVIDSPLTKRDLYRFIKIYTGKSLRSALSEDQDFWQQVIKKACHIMGRDFKADYQ